MEIETHNLKIPGNVPEVVHVLSPVPRQLPGQPGRGQQIVLFSAQVDKQWEKVKSAVSEN